MADALNSAVELHDSTVVSVVQVSHLIRVTLRPAYVHKSAGIPGVDPGSGYVQDFILEFDTARIELDFGTLPADILHGDLVIGDQKIDNMISLPCQITGPVSLIVFLAPDYRKAAVSGLKMKAVPAGREVYVEEFRR